MRSSQSAIAPRFPAWNLSAELVWYRSTDRCAITLIASAEGLNATSIETECLNALNADAASKPASRTPTPRAGTKQLMMIEVLHAESGAILGNIVANTYWEMDTERGAISEVHKKIGLTISSEENATHGCFCQVWSTSRLHGIAVGDFPSGSGVIHREGW